MKKIQAIAKHLVSHHIPEAEKDMHVAQRIVRVAQNVLSPEEFKVFQHKFIDYTQFSFPEINPLDILVNQEGKLINLANYRFPCHPFIERKGIIYFIHGYGDYVQRYAYFAQGFSDAGYDFVGLDQRGFGYSEGQRGFIESEHKTLEDINSHIDMVDAEYGGKEVKKYAIGFSLGGLLTAKLTAMRPGVFSSIALMAPYFQFLQRAKFEKFYPVLEELNKSDPARKLMILPMKPLPPEYTLHFVTDPICETRDISVRNLHQLSRGPQTLTDDLVTQITSSALLLLAGKDQVVDNTASDVFFGKLNVPRKQRLVYEDQDHMLFHERDQLSRITSDILNFFNQ